MSKQFNQLVEEACAVERELIALRAARLSPTAFVAECLGRGKLTAKDVDAVKERLAADGELMPGCRAYVQEVTDIIGAMRCHEPPARERIGRLGFRGKEEAMQELATCLKTPIAALFSLWVLAVERAGARHPECFGTIEDVPAHKAKCAALEVKRAELFEKISTGWDNSDVVIGKITSDGGALITYASAPGVTLAPLRSAGERLVTYLVNNGSP
ncbi:MAG: hypothetical protein ACREXS_14540 [Gammaproteobacteria bacterium]